MTAMQLVKTIASPFAALALVCISVLAQQPRQFTDENYAHAEKFMAYNVNPLASEGPSKRAVAGRQPLLVPRGGRAGSVTFWSMRPRDREDH